MACWVVALSMAMYSGVKPNANLAASPTAWAAGSLGASGAPPSCLGANDLLVSGETVALSGTKVLDRLCVIKRGKIVGSGT